MIKKRSEYMIALLNLMDDLPKKMGRESNILGIFVQTYHDQIPPEDLLELPSGEFRWEREVHSSRYNLEKEGLLDSPARGFWRLTEDGHQWILEHPEAKSKSIGVASRDKREELRKLSTGRQIDVSQSKEEFLILLQNELAKSLIPILGSSTPEFVIRPNYIQIRLAGFRGCHYELILRRETHEVALHFESSAEQSQARLQVFESYLDELRQKLGMRVDAGEFGKRGWTKVSIDRRTLPLTTVLAKEFSGFAVKFVGATYPILQRAYSSQRRDRHSIIRREFSGVGNSTHAILDNEIEAIRVYLQGRSVLQPEDEKLCDWVIFCYIFELYVEGIELFSLVSPDGVHPWYYERTKKIARLCALRAKNQNL